MLAGKVAEGLCSSVEEEDGTHAPMFYSRMHVHLMPNYIELGCRVQ